MRVPNRVLQSRYPDQSFPEIEFLDGGRLFEVVANSRMGAYKIFHNFQPVVSLS